MPLDFIPENEIDNQKPSGGLDFIPEEKAEDHPIRTEIINTANVGLRGIENYGADLANIPISAANYLNQKVAGLFGVKPEDVPTPNQINPNDIPAPFVKPEDLDKVNQRGEIANDIAQWIPIGMGSLALGKKGIETAGFAAKKLLGNNVDEKADNFINNLLGGTPLSEATQRVSEEIRGKYGNVQKAFGNEYKDFKSDVSDRGYSPTISKKFAGITPLTDEKAINSPNFEDALSKLDLNKYSSELSDAINNFKKNPSFSAAHDLQSTLGAEGSSLKTSKDGSDRLLGKNILKARRDLLGDIKNTFSENGDSDLAQQYSDITKRYKEQSTPYTANATLRNIVLKKDAQEINPTTINNLLKKNDAATRFVRENLSDQSKNLLLADALKGGIQAVPDSRGFISRVAVPDKIINLYKSTENKGLDYLRNSQHNQQIASLIKDLQRQQTVERISKILKWGAGLGLGAAGLNEVRKLL